MTNAPPAARGFTLNFASCVVVLMHLESPSRDDKCESIGLLQHEDFSAKPILFRLFQPGRARAESMRMDLSSRGR